MRKSILECMNFYEKELKERRYTFPGFAGMEPERCIGQIKKVVVDMQGDICENITIYTQGSAMAKDHYYGGGIDITNPIIDYLKDIIDWDEMIDEICDIINEEI